MSVAHRQVVLSIATHCWLPIVADRSVDPYLRGAADSDYEKPVIHGKGDDEDDVALSFGRQMKSN
ncbi:MAG: hypothetical protein MUF23_03680 [Pirellula sp.]|nr:hypothetical protein [Pirellula sp.]